MASDTKTTRSDCVYALLRADVLAGRRPPGQRLKFSDLSTSYDASVTVIREALTRLAGEGLVVAEPRLGYSVTDLSADRLNELTDARLELEAMVFARSVEHGDLQWESQMVAAHHRLENTPYLTTDEPVRITDEWAEAHARFHEALLEGCDNRRLYHIAIGLRSEAELYRRWSQPLGSEKNRDLAAEHRRLLDTALARNVPDAKQALREHISHTTRLLLDASGYVS